MISKLSFVAILLFTASFVNAQKGELVGVPGVKMKPLDGTVYVPKGFLQNESGDSTEIDAFYMGNEVTVEEFNLFLADLAQNPQDTIYVLNYEKLKTTRNRDEYFTAYLYKDILTKSIDTGIWKGDSNYEGYFSDPKFKNHPVVGVSYEGAFFYALWLTKKANIKAEENEMPYVVSYRLPTADEWQYAALNFKAHKKYKYSDKLMPVKKGKKNELGIRHLEDNVSEWCQTPVDNDKQMILGSSWANKRKNTDKYVVPANYQDKTTGFRLIQSASEWNQTYN